MDVSSEFGRRRNARPKHHPQPFSGSPRERSCDRGRRGDGRAPLRSRAAPPQPRGGEPPRTGCRRLPPRQLHQRRLGADRDEHLRREPPEAVSPLPRGRSGEDQLCRCKARARREGGHRPRRVHRRFDRTARRAGDVARPPRALRGAGRGAGRPRRRRLHDRDVLRSGGSRGCDRGGAQRLESPDRCAADIRRERRNAGRSHGRRSRRTADGTSTSRRSARTTARACSPHSQHSSRWARTASRWPLFRTSDWQA